MRTAERGAVSIFIVIFTALLVTIVTASFVQIMLRNQQQATNNDLSQSAYDSALAGVEDAKRALVALKACENDPSSTCSNLRSAMVAKGDTCTVLGDAAIGVANFAQGEVQVGNSSMNQAYTCVKVQVETDSYEGTLDQDQTAVIPLRSVGDPNNITGIRISWFMQKDVPDDGSVSTTPSYGAATVPKLPSLTVWPKNQPALMRSQLIQFAKGQLKLDDFNQVNTNTAKTLFLYPALSGTGSADYALDGRRSPGSTNQPLASHCETAYALNGGYACSIDIAVPALGTGTREAYLQLVSLYNRASFKVQMLGTGGTNGIINFDNVQPIVDSTGRASDLFRRVKARVSVSENGSGAPGTYPEAELLLGKSLCKDFFITNSVTDYNGGSCEPAN